MGSYRRTNQSANTSSLTSDSLGIKIPDINKVDDAIEHIMKPARNEPDVSLIIPTNTGEMNIDKPEKVIRDPQITETLFGAILASRMVSERSVGT